MKQVIYEDERGRKHLSTIRDTDTDPSIGFLQSPPDVDKLNWDEIKRTLHNLLLEKGIFTVRDAQRYQKDFNWCVLVAVQKPLFRMYQEEEND